MTKEMIGLAITVATAIIVSAFVGSMLALLVWSYI